MCCISNCFTSIKSLAAVGLIAGVVGFAAFNSSLFAEPPKDAAKQGQPKAAAKIGEPAPAFSLQDQDGKTVNLSDYKGKIVVLEWFNPGCPYVIAAHEKGILKDYAVQAAKEEIVFLAVATGKTAEKESIVGARKKWNMNYSVLMDADGAIGRAYGAKTTPHMFVINKDGKLAYSGAIDNAPMGKVEGGGEVVNYVAKAIKELKAGETVSTPETKAYGCQVKY